MHRSDIIRSAGGVPGIDEGLFKKLAKENESLKIRIGELGSLLSSNTIGASSAQKASTSGEAMTAEVSPCILFHTLI